LMALGWSPVGVKLLWSRKVSFMLIYGFEPRARPILRIDLGHANSHSYCWSFRLHRL
jgi:hypothetical protein